MSKCEKPKITSYTKSEAYIRVSVLPDYARFGSKGLKSEKDFVHLIQRRAFDLAACNAGLKVSLNDIKLPVKGLLIKFILQC